MNTNIFKLTKKSKYEYEYLEWYLQIRMQIFVILDWFIIFITLFGGGCAFSDGSGSVFMLVV